MANTRRLNGCKLDRAHRAHLGAAWVRPSPAMPPMRCSAEPSRRRRARRWAASRSRPRPAGSTITHLGLLPTGPATTISRRCPTETIGSGRRRSPTRSPKAASTIAAQHQNFALKPVQDWVRQLPGDELLAALPGDTPDDARMKNLVRKNCTGCHTAELSAAAPVRRGRLDRRARPDEARQRARHLSGTRAQGERDHRDPREGACGLSRAGARAGRDLDEIRSASAPVR